MNYKYYVYEWFLNDGRIFYVGKGTGKRYNHILDEIKTGKKHGYYYKKLQESFGINYRIVKDNLQEDEALKLESALINQRRKEGNYLIQFLVDFSQDDKDYLKKEEEQLEYYASRNFLPCVRIDQFHKFYYGLKDFEINFEPVSKELLLHPYTLYARNKLNNITTGKIEEEKEIIEKYVIGIDGNICKDYKKASSVIIFNDLDYIKFLEYKNENIHILHSFNVLKFINKNPLEEKDKNLYTFENDATNYKELLRNKPSDFIKFKNIFDKEFDNFNIYKKGMDLEKENPYLAIWFYEASLLTLKPWYYYPCYRLSILYKKYNLKKELYRILLLANDKAERDKSYFSYKLEKLKRGKK